MTSSCICMIGKEQSSGLDDEITGYAGNSGCAKCEAEWMISHTPEEKYGIFVEIGTYNGATCAYMAERRPWMTYVCVDPFPSHEGLDKLRNCIGSPENWMKNRRENMKLLVGTSDDAAFLFERKRADVCFIDGNHLYDFVTKDLHNCARILATDGRLFVHDIDREHQEEVRKAVDDFCAYYGWGIAGQVHTTVLLEKYGAQKQ